MSWIKNVNMTLLLNKTIFTIWMLVIVPTLPAIRLLQLNCATKKNVSSMHRILTSPPAPLLLGEGSKKPNFSLLLPLLAGEGGWVGEVCRIHVKKKGRAQYPSQKIPFYLID